MSDKSELPVAKKGKKELRLTNSQFYLLEWISKEPDSKTTYEKSRGKILDELHVLGLVVIVPPPGSSNKRINAKSVVSLTPKGVAELSKG